MVAKHINSDEIVNISINYFYNQKMHEIKIFYYGFNLYLIFLKFKK